MVRGCMLDAAHDSGVTIVRFPAGSWGDHNDVKTYQIDQFMAFAQKVGATAIFHVRLLDGTPEQAAEMVRYTNIEKKYNVQYWAIGNEPTLFNEELKGRGQSYDTTRHMFMNCIKSLGMNWSIHLQMILSLRFMPRGARMAL